MANISLPMINRKIQGLISPHVELVKGAGYHYFKWDDGERFDTESVMVMYTSHMPLTRWMAEARDFASKFLPDPTIAGGEFPIA